MAVKWAVANGSWAAGATWNDGNVPTADDEVYLNSFSVSIPNASDYIVVAQSISNGLCAATGNSGGSISGGYTILSNLIRREFSANIICDDISFTLLTGGNGVETIINGNVDVINGNLQNASASYRRFMTINGNVNVVNGLLTGNGTTALTQVTINGNATFRINPFPTNITFYNNNGITKIYNNITVPTLYINTIYCYNNSIAKCDDLYLSGSIYYENYLLNYQCGVAFQNITNYNPDTFIWRDISTPRVNPFIIVTNADLNNEIQYPNEDRVVEGTPYAFNQMVGRFTVDYPPESVVLNGYVYDNGNKTGNMSASAQVGCVTKEDVREGVPLIGMYEDGQQVVGTLVVPSADDVREGVVFDNGTIGTLIVQGGGDRLRIADFGHYTNIHSDTYINDITEADKPTFAIAEENILRANCPKIDLDNIEDAYFERDFILFLKYSIIVEYYRSAGVNSQFSPSEPTTEIVNYDYSKIEGWRNKANMYLNFWQAKHPDLARPQRVRL